MDCIFDGSSIILLKILLFTFKKLSFGFATGVINMTIPVIKPQIPMKRSNGNTTLKKLNIELMIIKREEAIIPPVKKSLLTIFKNSPFSCMYFLSKTLVSSSIFWIFYYSI